MPRKRKFHDLDRKRRRERLYQDVVVVVKRSGVNSEDMSWVLRLIHRKMANGEAL